MPIIPMRPLLEAAQKYDFAHGAFNVNSVAQAKAVIETHEMFRSAAIIQGADLANAFMGGCIDFKNGTIEDKKLGAKRIANAVKEYGESSWIPIALHLDHGKTFEAVKAAIDSGYTSVMIDGSYLPYEQNVDLTREVVKYAHSLGVTVEGELGVLAGIEDKVFSKTSTYTNPMKVCDFFRKTRVDCLAISYGTKHGAHKGKDIKIRKEIAISSSENLRHENIFGVLVSHGSSTVPQYIVDEINAMGGKITSANGIPIDQLEEVIKYGIRKINIDTDIRLAITRNIREYFAEYPEKRHSKSIGKIYSIMNDKPDQYDPRVYLPPIMETLLTGKIPDKDVAGIVDRIENGVKEIVGTMIIKFGSIGYAPSIKIASLEEMADYYKKVGI